DPEIAWAGLTERDAAEQGVRYEKLVFPWAASGRATTLARNDGLTKLLVDPATQRVLGVGIVGVGAGEMIAEWWLAGGVWGGVRGAQHAPAPDAIRDDHGGGRTGPRRGDTPREAEEGEQIDG